MVVRPALAEDFDAVEILGEIELLTDGKFRELPGPDDLALGGGGGGLMKF